RRATRTAKMPPTTISTAVPAMMPLETPVLARLSSLFTTGLVSEGLSETEGLSEGEGVTEGEGVSVAGGVTEGVGHQRVWHE
ncbi:MAG: hypothetical protein ACRDPW_01345, partial [Mycobacteriales bacterium]